MGVRVSSCPDTKKGPLRSFFSIFVLSVTRIPFGSSADLRTDDAQSASPDSEQIELAGAKPLRRNSVSVEQIQDGVTYKKREP